MATQQQLLDRLLAEHPAGAVPGFGETAARFFLNNAITIFCEETRLWRDVLTITTVADTTSYAVAATTSEVLRVTVPALGEGRVVPRLLTPIDAVVGPTDASAAPAVYYVEPDDAGDFRLHIGRLGDRSLTALAAGLAVNVKRVAYPDALRDHTLLYDADGLLVEDATGAAVTVADDGASDIVTIPEAFHFAPVHYANAQLYMLRADLPMPERLAMKKHHMEEYRRLKRPARAFGDRGLTSGIHPHPVYF